MSMEYPDMKVKKLYKFLMSKFPGEEALKSEKNSTLWNPIFNYSVDKLDRRDCSGPVERCSSTKELLMDYIEEE